MTCQATGSTAEVLVFRRLEMVRAAASMGIHVEMCLVIKLGFLGAQSLWPSSVKVFYVA